MVNKPLIRPYFWGGGTLGGGRLTSHDEWLIFYGKSVGKDTKLVPWILWPFFFEMAYDAVFQKKMKHLSRAFQLC